MRRRIGFDNMCCRKFERMPVAAGTPPSLSAFLRFQNSLSTSHFADN